MLEKALDSHKVCAGIEVTKTQFSDSRHGALFHAVEQIRIQVRHLDVVGRGRGAVPGVHGVVAVVAGQEAGHGLPAASVDFLVEHAAHLLSLAGASGISRHPWHREMQKRNLPPGQIPLLGMCLTEF